jgi:Mn-dependent DtxR family transcriptional regulator
MPPSSPDDVTSCVQLTVGEARYLLAIRGLSGEEGRSSQAALARKLGVSHPTALEMVRRLRQLALVEETGLELTPEGVRTALVLGQRRQAAQHLAHDVLGLDDEQAQLEGERLAATASPVLARRLVAWNASRPKDSEPEA